MCKIDYLLMIKRLNLFLTDTGCTNFSHVYMSYFSS